MAARDIINTPVLDIRSLSDVSNGHLLYLVTAFLFALLFYSFHGPKSGTPHLNPRGLLELTGNRSKQEFVLGAREMLHAWFSTHPSKPIRVTSDFGEVTVLPPEMANAIRNDDRLSFSSWISKVCCPCPSLPCV